jgi:hypothetical protein
MVNHGPEFSAKYDGNPYPKPSVFWSPLDQAAKDDFSLAVLQKSGKDRFLSMWLDIC